MIQERDTTSQESSELFHFNLQLVKAESLKQNIPKLIIPLCPQQLYLQLIDNVQIPIKI